MLKLSRVKLYKTRAERTTGRKVIVVSQECSSFVWLYRRHFATGFPLQITFYLLSFNMRVNGSETFSWPVALPVQGQCRKEVSREGKGKGPSEDELWTLDVLLTQYMLSALFCIHVHHTQAHFFFTWHRWARSTYSSCRLWHRLRR